MESSFYASPWRTGGNECRRGGKVQNEWSLSLSAGSVTPGNGETEGRGHFIHPKLTDRRPSSGSLKKKVWASHKWRKMIYFELNLSAFCASIFNIPSKKQRKTFLSIFSLLFLFFPNSLSARLLRWSHVFPVSRAQLRFGDLQGHSMVHVYNPEGSRWGYQGISHRHQTVKYRPVSFSFQRGWTFLDFGSAILKW